MRLLIPCMTVGAVTISVWVTALAPLGVSREVISLSPAIAAITLSRTQQFTTTLAGGGAVNWEVDGVAGGNNVLGRISATGLYSSGTAAGAHTIVATSSADPAVAATAVVAVTDLAGVYTYHNDLTRDGANTQEYALTTSSVNTAHFGKLTSCPVDGAIYAQPLWVANLTVNDAVHNVVFVATQHDSLFAFDADASPCIKLWSANLLDVSHGALKGETTVPGDLVGSGNGDITPEVGITGTPVIDPVKGILYVVTKSVDSAQTTFYQRLHAVDLATGKEQAGSPVTIDGTYPGSADGGTVVRFNARQQLQRAGLALVNGVTYIAWGAHEDTAPFYGWMMSYLYDGTAFTQKSILNTTPNTRGAGIWMGGGAPVVDSDNKLYVVTGNGGFDATSGSAPNNDYGDTLLQLTPSLQVLQWFTPSDQLDVSQSDRDFGSGGAVVLADLPAGNAVTHVLICGGKDATLYVVNRDLLGGFGDPAAVQTIDFGRSIYGSPAFWNNTLYMGGSFGPVRAFRLNMSTARLTLASESSNELGFPGATPSVSSAATRNGIVWTLDSAQYCTARSKRCGPVVLYAHDASNLGKELWNSALTAADTAGYGIKYTVPTVANGKVYVGTRGNNIGGATDSTSVPGEMEIYGLKP